MVEAVVEVPEVLLVEVRMLVLVKAWLYQELV